MTKNSESSNTYKAHISLHIKHIKHTLVCMFIFYIP